MSRYKKQRGTKPTDKKHQPTMPPNRKKRRPFQWVLGKLRWVLQKLGNLTPGEWISLATLIVLITYTGINYALYYTTNETLRAAQRPILLLDEKEGISIAGYRKDTLDEVLVKFKNTGKSPAQRPIFERWIAFAGDNSINVPPPGESWSNDDNTVISVDTLYTQPLQLTPEESAKLLKGPALIVGRVRYTDLSDVISQSWIQRWLYKPTTYCTSFCRAWNPGQGFLRCGGESDLCDTSSSHPVGFQTQNVRPQPRER